MWSLWKRRGSYSGDVVRLTVVSILEDDVAGHAALVWETVRVTAVLIPGDDVSHEALEFRRDYCTHRLLSAARRFLDIFLICEGLEVIFCFGSWEKCAFLDFLGNGYTNSSALVDC